MNDNNTLIIIIITMFITIIIIIIIILIRLTFASDASGCPTLDSKPPAPASALRLVEGCEAVLVAASCEASRGDNWRHSWRPFYTHSTDSCI